jgi:hypothetical protein
MPQGGGAFSGLVSGLVKGFGGTMLELEQQKHDDTIREKQTRINILQHAIDNDNLDDDSRQAALDQLGEIIDGKPGGKTSEKLKAILDPILAVGKLMGGVKTPPAPGTNENFGGMARPQQPPTGGGGFDIPAPPRRAGQPAPAALAQAEGARPVLKIKNKAQREQEVLDLDKKRMLQRLEVEDADRAAQLAKLPKELEVKIDTNIRLARKYYRVKDKENPNGRPLRDDEALPESYSQAIIEDAMGLPQARAVPNVKPQKVSEIDKAPDGAVDIEGKPVAGTGPFNVYLQPDGTKAYEPLTRKKLASEVKFDQDVTDEITANPKLTRAQAEVAVRTRNVQSRRLNIVNAQELASGRQLSNQMRKDILEGKVTPATARAALSTIRAEAQALARADQNGTLSPDSPYAGKSAPQIEEMLIPTYGFSKDELMKAIGGGSTTTTVPNPPARGGARPPLNSFEQPAGR